MYAELHKVANLQKLDISKERRCGQRKTPRQMEKLVATEVVSDKLRVEFQCDARCGRRT